MNKLSLGCVAALLIPTLAHADPAKLQPMQQLPPPQLMAMDYDHCLTATGSHIQGNTCIAADGVSYDRNLLQDTGAVSWSDVLRRDPSITLGNHR